MGEINPELVNEVSVPKMTLIVAFIKSPEAFAATNFADVVVIVNLDVMLPKLCVGARLVELNEYAGEIAL